MLEASGGVRRVASDEAISAATRRAPSASRARVRGALIAAARERDRSFSVDWATFSVHDLPDAGGLRPRPVGLVLDDPFADEVPEASALVALMLAEPRVAALGGFVPPPSPGRAASGGDPPTG